MSESSNSWFVQAGFGAVLGPMPDDALAEMARTGALLPTDAVRREGEDDWSPASNVMGLFSSSSPAASPSVAAEPIRSPAVEPDESLTLPNSSRRSSASPVQKEIVAAHAPAPSRMATKRPAAETSPPIESLVMADSAVPELPSDLIAAWKAERHQSRGDMGLISLSDNIQKDSDASVLMPRTTANEPTNADMASPSTVADADVFDPSPMARRPSLLSQISPRPKPPESFPEKVERWKRSLPSWPIAVGVVLLLVMAWWMWPRSSYGIYERYLAIWNEIQAKRATPNDDDGWNQLFERAARDLDDTIPWLEEHANNEAHDRQLLLWIGKDCLKKMVESGRAKVANSLEEQQMLSHFQELELFYNPSAQPSADAASSEVDGAALAEPTPDQPPEKAAAAPENNSEPTSRLNVGKRKLN